MPKFPGQIVRCVQVSQSLVGIAHQPEDHRRYALTTHTSVVPIEDGQRAVLLRIVEREALLQMGACKRQISHQERGGPQRVMALQQTRLVVSLLRELQTLLSQLARSLVRATPVVELPESPQDGEELRCLAHALTERARPSIGMFHLGSAKALRVHQCRAEDGL